ncbi:hypothetical protein GWK26_04805 [haloarchaeon 3A1-DGR]|nr:hypothetical protein GWK26_04805 [haloarchaeon 3A1-DGR]
MLPQRYSIDSLLNALRNPIEIYKEAGRIWDQVRFEATHEDAIDVMGRDWDYLLILDACRYDVFEDVNWIDGELDYAISAGSHSEEFCEVNFEGRTFYDTVYVTANAFGARIGDGAFHDLVYTGEEIDEDFVGWHSFSERMEPETIYEATIAAVERYPNKRAIAHFMQPHTPYFGGKAEEIRNRVADDGLVVRSRQPEKVEQYSLDDENVVVSLKEAAERGYVTHEEIREVYVENLRLVLEHVESLVEELDGKIVITSDHGEYLGENGKLGHPKYEYSEVVRKVPWLVIDAETRPEITAAESTKQTDVADEDIEEHLKDLGYRN